MGTGYQRGSWESAGTIHDGLAKVSGSMCGYHRSVWARLPENDAGGRIAQAADGRKGDLHTPTRSDLQTEFFAEEHWLRNRAGWVTIEHECVGELSPFLRLGAKPAADLCCAMLR